MKNIILLILSFLSFTSFSQDVKSTYTIKDIGSVNTNGFIIESIEFKLNITRKYNYKKDIWKQKKTLTVDF